MTVEQHELLPKLLGRTKARWLVNYAYHPHIGELYRDYPTKLLPQYASVKKIERGGKRDIRVENLLITNYDAAKLRERPFLNDQAALEIMNCILLRHSVAL